MKWICSIAVVAIVSMFGVASAGEVLSIQVDPVGRYARLTGDKETVQEFATAYALALYPRFIVESEGRTLRDQLASDPTVLSLQMPENRRAFETTLTRWRTHSRAMLSSTTRAVQESCQCGDGCTCGPDCPCRQATTTTVVTTRQPVMRVTATVKSRLWRHR